MSISWKRLGGLPSYGDILSFHLPGGRLLGEGIVFEFHIDDYAWIGNFAPGMGVHSAVHILASAVYVIAAGNGYRFEANVPMNYEILEPSVITDSRLVEEISTLVVAGLVNVSAYGGNGLLWATPRLSLDGVVLHECNRAAITGVASSVPGGGARYFSIETATGNCRFGASYP